MPAAARPRRQPTDDWQQLRLLVTSSEQTAHERLRPIVLFGRSPASRVPRTGTSEETQARGPVRLTGAEKSDVAAASLSARRAEQTAEPTWP